MMLSWHFLSSPLPEHHLPPARGHVWCLEWSEDAALAGAACGLVPGRHWTLLPSLLVLVLVRQNWFMGTASLFLSAAGGCTLGAQLPDGWSGENTRPLPRCEE